MDNKTIQGYIKGVPIYAGTDEYVAQQVAAAQGGAAPVPAPTSTPAPSPAPAPTGAVPVPTYGSTITDTAGRTGTSMFDPNTGKPLGPVSPQGGIASPYANPAPSDLTSKLLGYGLTQDQINKMASPEGLDPISFSSVMDTVKNKLESNNSLMTARQLLIKHLFDSPLTPDQIAKLPVDMQHIVQSGDRDAIQLQIRTINDEVAGRNSTLATSIQALTTGYDKAQADAKNAVSQFLAYAQSTGQPLDKVAKALAPLYGITITDQMMKNLEDLGVAVKPQAGQLGGAAGLTGSSAGLYGTATSTVSQKLGIDPNIMLSQAIATSGMDSVVNAMIANEGSSPKGVLNNPGNIKFVGLPGQINSNVKATDGKTFASYATIDDGRKAIETIIQNAADGNSSAYGPSPTLGSFVDKYTNTGPSPMSKFILTPTYPSGSFKNIVDPVLGVTPLALYNDAIDYSFTDKNIQSYTGGLSSGAKQTEYKNAVKNKSSSILDAMGLTRPQAAAIYGANKKAVSNNVDRLARVESVTNSVVNQLPRLAILADKIKQDGLNITESDIQAGAAAALRKFGNTDAAAYIELLQTVRADYAANNAALAGSRGGEFFARAATEAIPIGLSGDQYNSIKDQMVMSTKNIRDGIGSEVQSLLSQVGEGGSSDYTSGGSTGGTIAKGSMSDRDFVESALTSQGLSYNTVISQIPSGQKGVIDNATGQVGSIPFNEFDPSKYTSL